MKKTITALALAGLLTACGSPAEDSTRPGDPAVYQRIEQTTDCAKLQKEFDIAEHNGKTEYMAAADAQMEKAGCYR